MKTLFLPLVLLTILLTGCGTLLPKKVELFQDKVHKLPTLKQSEKEVQRQAAQLAAVRAAETAQAAFESGAGESITAPAEDTVALTGAVSGSLGPPIHPVKPEVTAREVSAKLNTVVAKLNRRIDNFREDNDENAGKKIEGTGLFQVPYFVWLGGFFALLFVGFIVFQVLRTFLKMYGVANPAVGLGLNAVSLGGKATANALSQVIKGGQKFKQRLSEVVEDPTLRGHIEKIFHSSHKEEQSPETRKAIDHLTE